MEDDWVTQRTSSGYKHFSFILALGLAVALYFELDGDDESHTIVALGSILGLVNHHAHYYYVLKSGWL